MIKSVRRAICVGMIFASVMAVSQQKPKARGARIITIAGRASDDGGIVLRNSDGKVWSIDNPEILKGHEGLPVVITAQAAPGKRNEVHVLSVEAGKSEVQYVTKWDDSAFRR